MDFRNVKKFEIPEGIVKQVEVPGGGIWKSTWLYTIKLGNYVTKVKYSTDNSTWISITANTTVEVDAEDTLYIKAETYTSEPRNYQYSYTMTDYNFDVTRTVDNDGGEVTVYRTATASVNSYALQGIYTNGAVAYYSDNAHTAVITTAAYSTTVYYVCSPSTGYKDTLSGSIVVNESNMTLNKDTLIATKDYGSATRITWSLAVTMSDYIASWTYKIDGGSVVSKSGNFTITGIDYASSVVVTATNQSELPWNYGTPTGTGTFSYNNSPSQSTTLASTRSRKSYTITFTNGTYGSWNKGNITAYYGDLISSSGKVVTVYKWDATSTVRDSSTYTLQEDTVQYYYTTSINPLTSPITASQIVTTTDVQHIQQYTITIKRNYYAITGQTTYASTTTADTDVIITKDYGESYSYIWEKTGYNSEETSGTVTGDKTVTLKMYPTTYWLRADITNWDGGYYGENGAKINKQYYGYTATLRITPTQHYEAYVNNVRYIYGDYITKTVTNAEDSVKYSAYKILYTCGGVTRDHGTVTWTQARWLEKTTYTLVPDTGYEVDGSDSGQLTVSVQAFTLDDATSTATCLEDPYLLGYCVPKTYTLTIYRKYYAPTGVQTKSSTATSDTTDSITVTYDAAYSYTYSKSDYEPQTISGTWTTDGNGTVTITLQPIQYQLTYTAVNWIAGWYDNNSYIGTPITWKYSGYFAYFRATPEKGYHLTYAGEHYANGDYQYATAKVAGGSKDLPAAVPLNLYTLTVNVTNGSYGTWSITRSSTESTATKTNLVNGDTIYEHDVLTATSSGKATEYGEWDFTELSDPVLSSTGDSAVPNITVTNNNNRQVTVTIAVNTEYYYTFTLGANSSRTFTNTDMPELAFNSRAHAVHFNATKSRSMTTYSADSTNYSGTASVTSSVIANFSFSRTIGTDTANVQSGVVLISVPAQNSYTVDVNDGSYCDSVYLSTDPNAASGDPSGTSYPYGTTVYAFGQPSNGCYLPHPPAVCVYGTDYEDGSRYRMGSVVVTGDYDFGDISGYANPTITIQKNSSSYTYVYLDDVEVSSGAVVSVKPGTDHYVRFESRSSLAYYLYFIDSVTNATFYSSSVTQTIDEVTRYRDATYKVSSVWSDITVSAVFKSYYLYRITWSSKAGLFNYPAGKCVPRTGTVTFNATGITIDVSGTDEINKYYSGSVTSNITFKSVELYGSTGEDTTYGKMKNGYYPYRYNNWEPVIIAETSFTPSASVHLSGNVIHSTSCYHTVTYNKINSGGTVALSTTSGYAYPVRLIATRWPHADYGVSLRILSSIGGNGCSIGGDSLCFVVGYASMWKMNYEKYFNVSCSPTIQTALSRTSVTTFTLTISSRYVMFNFSIGSTISSNPSYMVRLKYKFLYPSMYIDRAPTWKEGYRDMKKSGTISTGFGVLYSGTVYVGLGRIYNATKAELWGVDPSGCSSDWLIFSSTDEIESITYHTIGGYSDSEFIIEQRNV